LGRRIVERAGAILGQQRVSEPPVPTEPVEVVFEIAKADMDPVAGLQPGGKSLLSAAMEMGVRLDHFCGGECSCGTCRVEIIDGSQNLSRQDGMEQMVLGATNVAAGNRLACQARILGPVRVRVPEWF